MQQLSPNEVFNYLQTFKTLDKQCLHDNHWETCSNFEQYLRIPVIVDLSIQDFLEAGEFLYHEKLGIAFKSLSGFVYSSEVVSRVCKVL